MNKVLTSVLIGLVSLLTVVKAASVESLFPTEKPSVTFEAGYQSTYYVVGLQLSPGAAYGSVALSTPFKYVDFNLSAQTTGEKFSAFQAGLDKTLNLTDWLAINAAAGTGYYVVDGQDRNTVNATLTLEKLWVLNKVVTPYVGYTYDVTGLNLGNLASADFTNQGVTFGGKRPFTFGLTSWADLTLTPYAEFTHYENYQAFKAGGRVAFVLWNKLSPFAGVDYIDNNVDFSQKYSYDGVVQYTAGLSLTF